MNTYNAIALFYVPFMRWNYCKSVWLEVWVYLPWSIVMPLFIVEQTVMEVYIDNTVYLWAVLVNKDHDCFELQDKV